MFAPRLTLFACLLLALSGCFSGLPATPAPDAIASPSPLLDDAPNPTPPSLPSIEPDEALQPLSIDYLRSRSYPGSDFVTEEVLEPGVNYDRSVVSYQSDGLKIYALLTVPQEPMPPTGYPVIIFNHGYIPPDEYRTTERYVAYVDAFARSGYIVVRPDYRGHGDSEGDAANAYGSPDYVIDVLNALASARRHPQADPERVGMWGHSMGGYITIRAMVANQGVKAGVIWAGVVADYSEMFRTWFAPLSDRPGWRTDLVSAFGTPDDNPAFWNSLSANAYLQDLTGPVQIHHGTGDTTVPFAYSELLDEQIRAAGGSSELFLYDGDDHNIATNRDVALAISVVFFNQHVKGMYS